MQQASIDLDAFDAENAFLKRLKDHRAHVYPICEAYPAQERIRRAILDSKLDWVSFGKNPEGKPETYAQAFERMFCVPLDPTSATNRKVKSKC